MYYINNDFTTLIQQSALICSLDIIFFIPYTVNDFQIFTAPTKAQFHSYVFYS